VSTSSTMYITNAMYGAIQRTKKIRATTKCWAILRVFASWWLALETRATTKTRRTERTQKIRTGRQFPQMAAQCVWSHLNSTS
jgi:hypothetical protein